MGCRRFSGLTGERVNQLIPDLVEEVKTSSNSWIKGERLSKFRFEWQKGYGAFTHSRSQIDTELNIAVLCTYGYIFKLHFYKYYAALPLYIWPKGTEPNYSYSDLIVVHALRCRAT